MWSLKPWVGKGTAMNWQKRHSYPCSYGFIRFVQQISHCTLVFCNAGVYSKLSKYCCSCRAPAPWPCRAAFLNVHLCYPGSHTLCYFLLILGKYHFLQATPGALCYLEIVSKCVPRYFNTTCLCSLLLLVHVQRYPHPISPRSVAMKFPNLKLSSSSWHPPSSLVLSSCPRACVVPIHMPYFRSGAWAK